MMGKCKVLNYTGNQYSHFREPRIVLGPQWYYPAAEIILVNAISILVMIYGNHKRFEATYVLGIMFIIIQNMSFIYFVGQNPGFAQRDISMHS